MVDPVTFAILGTLLGGAGLKWFEMTLEKSGNKSKVTVEVRNLEEEERDKALACPYYFHRDYEDRAIGAGIMDKWDREVCDGKDCDYCRNYESDRSDARFKELKQKQFEEEESMRILAMHNRIERHEMWNNQRKKRMGY